MASRHWRQLRLLGHRGRPLLTNIKNDAGGSARGVQGKYSLDAHVHGWVVEGLEKDLGHLFTVGFWVQGCLAHETGVLLWGHAQLVVEGMVPDFLHIVPVCDDTVLDGVFQAKDTPLALGLISYIGVLLTHAHHHTLE